jgi:His/Glu/Gln/Arg/opine family amino acid ABC transporter permease subunit
MRFQPLFDQLPLLAAGLQVTVITWLLASLLSVVIGVLLGIWSQLGDQRVYVLIRAFVYFFRGIPLLVLLFLAYYALPAFGLNLPGTVAGILAFGLNSGGYMTEVVRSALESVDVSQKEASALDGASNWVTLTRVVFPQATPRMIAPGTNQIVSLIKGTSLLSVISVTDVTRAAQLIAAANFNPLEVYLSLGVLFVAMVAVLTRASTLLERWLGRALFA